MFSAVNVVFRDAENLIDLMLLVVTWTSPVLYRWTDVRAVTGDGWLLALYQANPVTIAVELFHWCFWFPGTSGTAELPAHLLRSALLGLAIGGVVLLVGQMVFRRLEGRFAQEL